MYAYEALRDRAERAGNKSRLHTPVPLAYVLVLVGVALFWRDVYLLIRKENAHVLQNHGSHLYPYVAPPHGGYATPNISNRAVFTALYDDSYLLPACVLGYSLRKAKVQARMIGMYIPEQVSQISLRQMESQGWDMVPVERIAPPHPGTSQHFKDQYTKLHLWNVSFEMVIYLDADTLVLQNFDELWSYPVQFAAVPDVWTAGAAFDNNINAGVLLLRPNTMVFAHMMRQLRVLEFPISMAEQAFLNECSRYSVTRLSYVYNANEALKIVAPKAWHELLKATKIIHYTLYKPHWSDKQPTRGHGRKLGPESDLWRNMRDEMTRRERTWG